ncbi:hypothetical protein C9I98_16570 [Photobacterium sanctipauli]|uniref:Uncharacterized protein n=1 Tax=Photobacterium sanctipauli TaxID=1342794 RepID=A0A2T3NPV5_9GAMM|nr:hypothetical protein [Photobacterium sanctipauli]PSW18316.1 hypothetical protein C9I98_16570 [Photobacterium sanctipauli]
MFILTLWSTILLQVRNIGFRDVFFALFKINGLSFVWLVIEMLNCGLAIKAMKCGYGGGLVFFMLDFWWVVVVLVALIDANGAILC